MFAASIIRTMSASTSETSVNFYKTTQRNNPEDSHLQVLEGLRQRIHRESPRCIMTMRLPTQRFQ
jgi:hypothetical protein